MDRKVGKQSGDVVRDWVLHKKNLFGALPELVFL